MVDKIIQALKKIKTIKDWSLEDKEIRIKFKDTIYYGEDALIDKVMRKYKKVSEICEDYSSIIVRDVV